MYQSPVYVPECCLCTTVLSMYKSGVYVPEWCQWTSVVSMYQSAVNVHEWCLCTKVLSMYQNGVMYQSAVYVPEWCLCAYASAQYFCGTSHDSMEGLWMIKFASNKIRFSINFQNSRKNLMKSSTCFCFCFTIYTKKKMFTIEKRSALKHSYQYSF